MQPASERFAFTSHMHLADTPWRVSLYNSLCFADRRWQLLYTAGAGRPPPQSTYSSAGFERFSVRLLRVRNRTEALAAKRRQCWVDGVVFVADLKHAGGGAMGIAHFAKRILRLWGIVRQHEVYRIPDVQHIVFPSTSALQLAHDWPQSMIKLIAPSGVLTTPAENLLRSPCCYEHVVVSGRANTYFVREEDANELRLRAYRMAGVAEQRDTCAPPSLCYFRRSEGAAGGKWEGGPRVIVNVLDVLGIMEAAAQGAGARMRVVNANSSHSFAEQVQLFASCNVLVSVHGSHNANVMWMRPRSAFIELNPFLFYYAAYRELATVSGIDYLPSRRNQIGVTTGTLGVKAARFKKEFARWTDVACQEHTRCRSLARSFPTRVNMSDFKTALERGVQQVVASAVHACALRPASSSSAEQTRGAPQSRPGELRAASVKARVSPIR